MKGSQKHKIQFYHMVFEMFEMLYFFLFPNPMWTCPPCVPRPMLQHSLAFALTETMLNQPKTIHWKPSHARAWWSMSSRTGEAQCAEYTDLGLGEVVALSSGLYSTLDYSF